MKNFGYTLSILNNTNRAVSHSECDWRALRDGSLCVIDNDNVFYTVAKTEPFLYKKSFELVSPNRINIKENVSIDLQETDTVKISYKEYELLTLISIKNGGKDYKLGEKISIPTGIPSINIQDNTPKETIFLITQINPNGGLERLELLDKGQYIIPPEKLSPIKSNNGEGGILDVEYKTRELDKEIERVVTKVENNNLESFVTFNFPLPSGVKYGVLSCKKYQFYLNSNYVGESKIGKNYKILRDATPNFNIPLLVKNSLSSELIINEAFKIIDYKLKELSDKIN